MPYPIKTIPHKALAERFAAQHLEAHGQRPAHHKLLQHAAFRRGAKSWDELLAEHEKKGFLQKRLPWLFGPPLLNLVIGWNELLYHTPQKSLRLGLAARNTEAIDLPDNLLRRHILTIAPSGSGWRSFFAHLAVQQVARGGGLLVIDPEADDWFPLEIGRTLEKVARKECFFRTPGAAHEGDVLKTLLPLKFERCVGARPTQDALAKVDLNTLLQSKACAYFGFEWSTDKSKDDAFAQQLANKLVAAITSMLTARIDNATARQDDVPFMVMLPACQGLLAHLNPAVLAQARAMGVVFVMQTAALTELTEPGALDVALANTATKVFFKPATLESKLKSAELLHQAATAKGTKQMSVADWESTLGELYMAEAVLLTANRTQHLSTCLLKLEDA